MEWARRHRKGFEVSSKGDKRFSAFYAKLCNGQTIEQAYQRAKGSGKGKPSVHANFDYWGTYLGLWKQWANENPSLVDELFSLSRGKVLTDMFASTDNNQARALSVILTEKEKDMKGYTTRVVNLQKDQYDVYIGRGGKGKNGYFGSPVVIGKECPVCRDIHRTNKDTIPCYTQYAKNRMKKDPVFVQKVAELKGKVLGCFCKPEACHGDVLAMMAESAGLGKPTRWYAAIGSRETPREVLALVTKCASKLEGESWGMSSGGAAGFDSAAEAGVQHPGSKRIFLKEDCTPEAEALSAKHHPNWERCSPIAKKLHGRNAMILLGADLKNPVEFVLCWTKEAKVAGGTGQGIRIAKAHGIPVFNMADPTWTKQVAAWKAGKLPVKAKAEVKAKVATPTSKFEEHLAKGKVSLDPENPNYYRR